MAEARSGFDCSARLRSLYLIARSARCDVRRKPPSSSNPTKPPLTCPALATTRFVDFSCISAAGTSRARIAPWSPPTSSTLAHERACLLAPSTLLAPLAEAGAWWPLPSSLARRRKTCLLPRSSRTAARQPGSARRRRDPDKRLRLVDEPAGGDGRHTGRQRSRIQPRQRSGSFQIATFHIPDGKTGQGSLLYGPRAIGKGCPVRCPGRGVKSSDDAQPLARLRMPHGSPYAGPACERVTGESVPNARGTPERSSVPHRFIAWARLGPRRCSYSSPGLPHAASKAGCMLATTPSSAKGCDVGVGDHLDVLQAMPGRADASGPELRRRPPQT